ncbi:MAG: response regulator [Lachnospiraceae bacterium]|nr:response regulator [Lachnospiraceae bacterium]
MNTSNDNLSINNSKSTRFAFAGILIVAVILILGTLWNGESARRATDDAVHSVSLLYLDELAGRREQVVAHNLENNINNLQVAVGLMDKNDLSDAEHLQAYQSRIKQLYGLEKFAFVDTEGQIFTSNGMLEGTNGLRFDLKNMSGPEIVLREYEDGKKVEIAMPLNDLQFMDHKLVVCFMEMDVDRMLQGVSLQSDANNTTFCNLYTGNGEPLTDVVLGGLASEDNLLDALQHADFANGYSREKMLEDFADSKEGVASFTYNGIQETMYYKPVERTNWMLTYLIRESLISEQISSISGGIITRSILQTLLTAIVLLGMFGILFVQTRRSAQLAVEKETAETASRIRQQELEQRLELQQELLEKEKQRAEQDQMITAMASDYRSVYYVDLDSDHGVCYRAAPGTDNGIQEKQEFCFSKEFTDYAMNFVAEEYRDGFLRFIEPDRIRESLEKEVIITYRYLVHRNGKEYYEMLRMAGVRQADDRDDGAIHAVGVGFTIIDREMRETMAKNQALSDALTAAEEASKAKTAFLSSMSHEIRTPMNAIIGLDNIALHDPGLSDQTRDHLEKIGSSAQHLLNLINDILDMSRIESGRMTLRNEEFSLQKLLEQINTMLSSQCQDKGLSYNCRVLGEVADQYIGDDMKLRQVLINILSNAVKFTPEGGSVEMTVEQTVKFDNKATLRFAISDTGIGMDREFLPKIFEAFSQEDSSSTNRFGSSGLGLAITKNIVEMMNGTIEVESEKGVGSTFTVTVTLMEAESSLSEAGEELQPHEMTVLVVDDDPVACEHARLVLEKVGIAAETVMSGEEAIEVVRLRHARREPFNLILVDWKMPGLDGVETTRQIRSIIGNESAIIILTAYKWDDIQEEAVKAGVDSFISKPLFASNVMDEFRSAMKRKTVGEHKQAGGAGLEGCRVLLAEDMPINAEIITMVLSMRDIETDLAENGKIAVEKYTSHPEGWYDAVLMDMRMPEMDGLTATGLIRDSGRADAKKIPIIALTANAFDEDVQRSLQAGLNAHLSKPVDPDVLFETLESLIRTVKR